MPAIDGSQVVINSIRLTEQAAAPSTPAANSWKLFFKADGLYLVDDTGSVSGPLGGGTPTFHGAKANRTTDQSINDSTWTAVLLPNEDYDTDAYHSTSVNTSRFTIPTGRAGYYSLKAHVQWDVNATGDRYVGFRVNGGTTQHAVAGYARTSAYFIGFNTADILLAAGDYVELFVYQNAGGALAIKSAYLAAALMGS